MSKSYSQTGSALLLSVAITLSLGSLLPVQIFAGQPALAADGPAWLNNESTFLERGKRSYNSGQFDQAIKELSGCININPQRSEALYWRSLSFSALHDYVSAMADLDRAIRVDPGNPVLFLNRGLIYSNQGKHESAVSDFDQALKLDPGLVEAKQNREFCQKEIEKAKGAPAKTSEPEGSSSASTIASNTEGGAGSASSSSTAGGASGGYVPYTGKASARLATAEKEQRESQAKYSRQQAELEREAALKNKSETDKLAMELKAKETELKVEELRLKREQLEAEMASKEKAKAPEPAASRTKDTAAAAAELSKKQTIVAANKEEADSDALEIVNRPVRDKWALVVGISQFKDPSLNLHYPAKDAKDFYDFLVTDGHFKKDHVKLLTNEQATRDNILEELGDTWLPHVADADDLVLIYVSSHGSPSEMDKGGGNINYLIAYDTNIDKLYATGLPMQDLTKAIKSRVNASRVVVVLDACHSGGAGAKGLKRTHNIDAAEISQGTGQLVISSSGPSEVSWESKKYENSVFTHFLIESLRKNGEKTTLGEAFEALEDSVHKEVLSDRGAMQTPALSSQWKGDALRLCAPPTAAAP